MKETLLGAEQMKVCLNQAKEIVLRTADEELDGPDFRFVHRREQAEGHRVPFACPAVGEGAQVEFSLAVDEMHAHRGGLGVAFVPLLWSVRRQEFGNDAGHQKHGEDTHTDQGHAVFLELPPHELPVGGGIAAANALQGGRHARLDRVVRPD